MRKHRVLLHNTWNNGFHVKSVLHNTWKITMDFNLRARPSILGRYLQSRRMRFTVLLNSTLEDRLQKSREPTDNGDS